MRQDCPEQLVEESKRSVLGRVFDILDCFTHEDAEQTIGSICARTGLAPATVHRLLAGLVEWGAIERSSRGRYRLGVRLWRLGWAVPHVRNLRDVARPFLVDLHSATGAVVCLGSRDGTEIMVADVIAGHTATRGADVRRRLPMLTSAPGLVMLAHSPVDLLDEVSRDAGVPGRPPREDFALRQRLSEIRRAGVAVVRADRPGGPAWLSAPVFSEDNTIRTTVSIAVPDRGANVRALVPVVASAARGISRALGHRGGPGMHIRHVSA